MDRFPASLIEFQQQFGSEEACVRYLAALRWPDGFVCPCCQSRRHWALKTKPDTFECAHCRRQTSVTAGTLLHASKLPLSVWFRAAYFMATHTHDLSARQLQSLLGLGSYRTAWMLAAKLRRAMVAPDRRSLAGLVEVDDTSTTLAVLFTFALGEPLMTEGAADPWQDSQSGKDSFADGGQRRLWRRAALAWTRFFPAPAHG